MGQRIVLASERRDLWERGLEATEGVWPEYNLHGDTTNVYWGRLDEDFPEFQFVLHDEEAGEIVAQGYSLPLHWDGTEPGLPAGFDGLLEDGFALREKGGEPNALSALAIEVPAAQRGRGTSQTMVQTMRALAAERGFGAALAPLRPVWKERYPLVGIDRYAAWTRADGLPFDPWIRMHVALGARILRSEPRSLRISGTVGDWEDWTGMEFPETGKYVFPQGLAPLMIDREADTGLYFEPNVWVVHAAV